MFCGCQNIDCSSCWVYNLSTTCAPNIINIPSSNLINGTTYYLWIVDKFNNVYKSTAIGQANGSFNISQTDSNFPIGLFMGGVGKRDIFLTTDSIGNDEQPLIYGAVSYNCVILGIPAQMPQPSNAGKLCQ